ncbi:MULTISPECIES: helix-turn-helix domain-containing protein [unclassified Bartonella]|uniref:helix-turn-helix domain-containing protein n=1 Tax=unclassified Bartonella TaxID=2645622 RepID=UPI002362FEAA|nr:MULTISPECIES: helix-turn-helix transcriptional regulator [unclassified Bartonella]
MRGRSQPVEGESQVKNPHVNDISVGKKIRCRRRMMGLSQKALGHHLGVSFQQIQKYEKGINRVGAGRLQEIANILDVPIHFFYMDIATKETLSQQSYAEIFSEKETLLLKNFRELKPKKQKALLWLISD